MIEIPSQPLDQEWEKAATKDLIDILQWLAHGSFVSADDFCERLRQTEEAIRVVYGAPVNRLERHAQWRANMEAFAEANKVVPIRTESGDIDPSDPNYGGNQT